MVNGIYYHASSERLPEGFGLIPMLGSKMLSGDLSPSETRIESIFEEIRAKEFPNRPSRLNSVFATPEPRKWSMRKYNHVVYCGGDTFTTDMETYDEAVIGMEAQGGLEFAECLARMYWEARGEFSKPEILIDGEATIVKRLN